MYIQNRTFNGTKIVYFFEFVHEKNTFLTFIT